MSGKVFEFDVTVRIRRRLHVEGPANREAARKVLKNLIRDGLPMDIFSKRDRVSGHLIETILDNDFEIEDAAAGTA